MVSKKRMKRKSSISKALREQVWINHIGKKFENKCLISWCSNKINVFDFQCGHNIPESKGGTLDISNLMPICSRCNSSMGNSYTINEWMKQSKPPKKWMFWIHRIFPLRWISSDTTENGSKSTQNPTNLKDKHMK